MAEPTARESKLIQYLNEAYGKEKQLETTLQAQIGIAQKDALKKRLKEHLKETKGQIRGLEKRIKQLGGKAEAAGVPGPEVATRAASAATSVANKAMAAAKGPVQALRGTSEADNQLRNVRDAFWNEAEEIAHYLAIEALAEKLQDRETAKLAKEFRKQEERMQKFLERQINSLVGDVIRSEIPAKERKPASASRSRSSSRSSGSRSSGSRSSSRSSSSGSRSTSRSSSSRSSSSGGSSASRSQAAKKAARTRQANANKRSQAAKKAARTRKQSS